jgi:prevent-host-death family protein
MSSHYSIAEAKNKLPAIVHEVENGPAIKLTRHGRPVAILLSLREYERMQGKSRGFWQNLMSVRRQMSLDGVTISGEEFSGLRDDSPGRPVD